jgi:cytochrome c-type biogenesis protein
MLSQLTEAFVLGNASILTNVCMLPLYPSMVAFLAADVNRGKAGKEDTGGGGGGVEPRGPELARAWLGVLVLAGVLTTMMVVGLALYLLRQSFGALLPWLLPLVYGGVIVLGVLLLLGCNPFARLATVDAPVVKSPFLTAFAYGLLLGPMTLPCAGPLIVSAFVLGAGSVASLADGLLYALAFGLGFGWPLVALPLLTVPTQRHLTRWLAGRYGLLTRAAGVILVGIGLFGAWAEVVPSL